MSNKKITESKPFKDARTDAESIDQNAERIHQLVDEAVKKIQNIRARGGPLSQVFDDLATMIRLITAYCTDKYRMVPWEALIMVLCGLIYFVNPADVLPDIIPGLGFLDDIIAIAFIVRTVQAVLDDFRRWEEAHDRE